MSKIRVYYDYEVPIPDDAHPDRVSVYIWVDDGTGKREKVYIGRYTSKEGLMVPNDQYRQRYPRLWEMYVDDLKRFPPAYVHCGAFAVALGIGWMTDLYPTLQDVYGLKVGNAIMDWVMYGILSQSNVAAAFASDMQKEVLFSEKAWSGGWLSDLFANQLNEDQNREFQIRWLHICRIKYSVKSVQLCIDGSNDDCEIVKCKFAEQGEPKSHSSCNIFTFMYAIAVDTEYDPKIRNQKMDLGSFAHRLPVLCFLDRGNKVDPKLFMKMAHMLSANDIQIGGVIVDKTFGNANVLNMITECGYSYTVNLRKNNYGLQQMMEHYSREIFWNVKYAIGKGLMGITSEKPIQIFQDHPNKAYIHLYFDGRNGTERSLALYEKVWSGYEEVRAKLNAGTLKSVPNYLKDYVSLIVDESGNITGAVLNTDKWQKDSDAKGYYGLATYDKVSAAEADRRYDLRDYSEKGNMYTKSMTGNHRMRVHSTESVLGKFAIVFPEMIVRSSITNISVDLGMDTNALIRELIFITLERMRGEVYEYCDDLSQRQLKILSYVNMDPTSLKIIAQWYNHWRRDPIMSQQHPMPELMKAEINHTQHTTKSSKGSKKSKKTNERKTQQTAEQAAEQATELNTEPAAEPTAELNTEQTAEPAAERTAEPAAEPAAERTAEQAAEQTSNKNKVGRPRGSKNRKTLDLEAQPAATAGDSQPKRGPGRPKGSKNRKALELEAQQAAEQTE